MLSADKKVALQYRYEVWGLDEVRKELERTDRDQFADPEVTAFAKAWVEDQDARFQRHTRRRQLILSAIALVLMGCILAFALEI